MLSESPTFEACHGKRPLCGAYVLAGLQFCQGQRRQARIEMEVEFRLRAGLTVTQTGKLFGIAKQKFDLEARLVIAVEREHVQGDISAKEYGTTLSLGIDHEDDAQVASELHMIDHLVIEHPMIVLHVEPLKPSQVGPPHLAVVDFGTSRARTLWAIVEIPQIGVCAQLPNLHGA